MAATRARREGRDAVAARIGAAVRAARTERALTTRQLAELIGTSQPFVSNIENGRIFPSLRTLALLADALEVPATRLLPSGERRERVPAAVGTHERRRDEPAARLLLGGDAAAEPRELEVRRVELRPGEAEPQPFLHDGEDFVTALAGELDVLREGEPPTRLRAGDSIWLDGAVPHRLAARSGAEAPGIALVVVASTASGTAHTS